MGAQRIGKNNKGLVGANKEREQEIQKHNVGKRI
jgi:hypothetical protein